MQVLVEHGKHGEWYHDASTTEALHASALAILTERWEAGYYYYDPGDPPEYDGLSKDERAALREQDEELGKRATAKWNRYVQDKRRWQHEKAEFERIKRAFEEKDGSLALECLENRSDYEYERIEIEAVTTHAVSE